MTYPKWVGRRIGRLVVIETLPNLKVRCLCDCGNKTIVYRCNLSRRNTRSCGCLWREKVAGAIKHGKCNTTEYVSWSQMKSRCLNPKSAIFGYYGGRGITIVPQWKDSFSEFLNDMGLKPTPAHTLERVDNDKGYSPENCVWATRKQQAQNRRPRDSCNVLINV